MIMAKNAVHYTNSNNYKCCTRGEWQIKNQTSRRFTRRRRARRCPQDGGRARPEAERSQVMATRRARRGRATSGARRGRSYGRPAKGDGVDDDARRAAAEGSECEPWSQRRALARGRVVGRRGRARLGFGVVLAHRWRGGRRVRRDRAVVADKRAKRCRRATRGLVAVRVARHPRAGCLQLWVHSRRRRGGGPGRKGQRRRGVAVGWRMRHLRRPRERLILSFFVPVSYTHLTLPTNREV